MNSNICRMTYGPKNPFSGSSSKVLKGFFDRFEKFSFSVILGRLKVEIDDFPIINSIGKTHGKPCFLASILTMRRPKITGNENFPNRSKNPFNTLLELPENGFLGPQVARERFGSCLSQYTPPSAAVSNNYLHMCIIE